MKFILAMLMIVVARAALIQGEGPDSGACRAALDDLGCKVEDQGDGFLIDCTEKRIIGLESLKVCQTSARIYA